MSRGGVRAGIAVFLIGLLLIWLVRPIGNPCPDVDKLPSGSDGSSAPSLAPPLTRTCTYSTPDGTQARRRYLPVIDLVALLLAAVVVGAAIGRAGRGRREPRPQRAAEPSAPAVAERAERERVQGGRGADERERARQEREARRSG